MKFKNPANGYVEESSELAAVLVTLLIAPLYFLIKGAIGMALASLVAALCTFGLSNIVFAFCAPSITRQNYLRNGWVEIIEDDQDSSSEPSFVAIKCFGLIIAVIVIGQFLLGFLRGLLGH